MPLTPIWREKNVQGIENVLEHNARKTRTEREGKSGVRLVLLLGLFHKASALS